MKFADPLFCAKHSRIHKKRKIKQCGRCGVPTCDCQEKIEHTEFFIDSYHICKPCQENRERYKLKYCFKHKKEHDQKKVEICKDCGQSTCDFRESIECEIVTMYRVIRCQPCDKKFHK